MRFVVLLFASDENHADVGPEEGKQWKIRKVCLMQGQVFFCFLFVCFTSDRI